MEQDTKQVEVSREKGQGFDAVMEKADQVEESVKKISSGCSWIFSIVSFLCLLCITPFMFIGSMDAYRQADATLSWTPTKCVVAKSEVKMDLISSGVGLDSGFDLDPEFGIDPSLFDNIPGEYNSQMISFSPKIVCEFSVGGKVYKSKTLVVMSGGSTDLHNVQAKVNEYPLGAEVDVFYDPGNPANSVLETGQSTGTYSFLTFSILMAVLVLLLFFGGVIRWKPFHKLLGWLRPIILNVLGIVIIGGIGALLFYLGDDLQSRPIPSTSWPTVTGEVVRTNLDHTAPEGDSFYTAQIVYRYEVDGQVNLADVISDVQSNFDERELAESFMAKYPEGTKVDVYYHPEYPENATLDPANTSASLIEGGNTSIMAAYIFFGLSALWVFLILLYLLLKNKIARFLNRRGIPSDLVGIPKEHVMRSVFGGLSLRRAWQSKKWPSVTGTILSAELVQVPFGGGEEEAFQMVVQYSYRVDDAEYTGDLICFGQIGSVDQDYSENQLTRFVAGNEMSVYYDPNDHHVAVLEPGISLSTLVGPVLALYTFFTLWQSIIGLDLVAIKRVFGFIALLRKGVNTAPYQYFKS